MQALAQWLIPVGSGCASRWLTEPRLGGVTSTSAQLRAALDGLLDGLTPTRAAAAVDRLMTGYRDRSAEAPLLRDRADVLAYAAYRMPATYEAVAAALEQFAARVPGWTPASHLDVGGGTGAAAWAASGIWPGEPGRRAITVLDRAGPALELGRELARMATDSSLRSAQWRQERLTASLELPAVDLVTVSYLLGELPDEGRAVVDAAARAGRAVVIVEPGTPDGYLRVRSARERLTAAGFQVLAPCPHSVGCPVAVGTDWCHFAARVSRSALHRRVKGGALPYEDEKFSYVAAVREVPRTAGPASGRIVRRPRPRKGQVLLDLCTSEGELRSATVSKRDRESYRSARDAGWGAPWPPEG